MTYRMIEKAFRSAARRTLGKECPDFENKFCTYDPDEGIDIDDFKLGKTVEAVFDKEGTPFEFFSGDIAAFASEVNGVGLLHVFFGNHCSDPKLAEGLASELIDSDYTVLWRLEEDPAEDSGLFLTAEFNYDTEDEKGLEDAFETVLSELCEKEFVEKLKVVLWFFKD